MYIKQLYTSGLSEAAYYIESEGEAAIINPLRDIEEYLLLAKERQTVIRYIFETHFHADFVSAHIDLSKATGAPIVYGPNTETNFSIHSAADGEVFKIGKLQLQVLHTPGHTLESTCYLLKDENERDHAIFTGDTLFVGNVGRPDLSSGNNTSQELAGLLYDSLQQKIMPLADDIIVYPAHGKSLGSETFSTIQEQKQTNYALQSQSKDEFIKAVTEGLHEPPVDFPIDARINKAGYKSNDEVLEKALNPLSLKVFKEKLEEDVFVVDTRPSTVFVQGFVPGSISIDLEGRFAEWAGNLLSLDKPMVLVTGPGQEKESVTRLSRVGLSKIEGFLQGGYEAWTQAGEVIDMIIEVESDELAMDIPFDDKLIVVDVRKEVEYADGHVKGALNIPLANLVDPGSLANIEDTDNLYVHCASGYRSVIAISLMKRQGFNNIRNVLGGWAKIKEEEGIETEKDAAVLN